MRDLRFKNKGVVWDDNLDVTARISFTKLPVSSLHVVTHTVPAHWRYFSPAGIICEERPNHVLVVDYGVVHVDLERAKWAIVRKPPGLFPKWTTRWQF